METKTAYLTRRAREERASAALAASSSARTAHLELAVRLVRAATAPSSSLAPPAHNADARVPSEPGGSSGAKIDDALAIAFPMASTSEFEHLLKRID